jgi:hypothetical protein
MEIPSRTQRACHPINTFQSHACITIVIIIIIIIHFPYFTALQLVLKRVRVSMSNDLFSFFQARPQNFEKRLLASSSLSVRSPVLMEQPGSQWTDFNKI